VSRRSVLTVVMAVAVAVVGSMPGESSAVPPRRLLRRGVVVVPPPGTATQAPTKPPAAPGVRPTPAPAPAPAAASAAAATRPRTPSPTPATPAANVSFAAAAFTPDWFARHPQAWRPTGPATDWWQAAAEPAVAAWLSRPVTVAGGVEAGTGGVQVAAAEAGIGPDGLQSVLVLPAGHDNEEVASRADADWLSLGVFALVPAGGGQPHDYQLLAVDRAGRIKGTFYDPVSDTTQPISGTLDRETRIASWTVGVGGSRFSAPVAAFAAATRPVAVVAGGRSWTMDLVPVPKP